MGLAGIINLPIFEHNRFSLHGSLLHLERLVGRDCVEELLHSADMRLGAEFLVQLHRKLLLGVLLGRTGTHKVAQRLNCLRDKRQRSVCLYVLQTRRNKN